MSGSLVLPALHMVWDRDAPRTPSAMPSGYDIVAIESEWLSHARGVVELDGTRTDAEWNVFAGRVVPDGMFMALERKSAEWIGTVSGIHNPRGGRFYFPDGGEIGCLVVAQSHRGRGLGAALVTAAVTRLQAAGYPHIWLDVQDRQLSAIRTCLYCGFVPFLHAPDPDALETRWQHVFEMLEQLADTSRWMRALPNDQAANRRRP